MLVLGGRAGQVNAGTCRVPIICKSYGIHIVKNNTSSCLLLLICGPPRVLFSCSFRFLVPTLDASCTYLSALSSKALYPHASLFYKPIPIITVRILSESMQGMIGVAFHYK